MTSPRAAGGVAAASATPMATPAVPLTTPNTATSARSGTLSLTCGNNAVATDPARTPPTAYGADRWVRSISHPAGTRAAVFAMPRTRKTSPMAAGERPLASPSNGKNVKTTPCVRRPLAATIHPAQTLGLARTSRNVARAADVVCAGCTLIAKPSANTIAAPAALAPKAAR